MNPRAEPGCTRRPRLLSIPPDYNKGPSRGEELGTWSSCKAKEEVLLLFCTRRTCCSGTVGRTGTERSIRRRTVNGKKKKSSGTAATAVEATRRAEAGRLCLRRDRVRTVVAIVRVQEGVAVCSMATVQGIDGAERSRHRSRERKVANERVDTTVGRSQRS